MAWVRFCSSWRVAFFSISTTALLVVAYVGLSWSFLSSRHPRVGGFSAGFTQWKRSLAEDEGLKPSVYTRTESRGTDIDRVGRGFESLSQLFKKLHALENVIAMQKEGVESISLAHPTSEKAILEEYKKIKQLILSRLKNSVQLAKALDNEHRPVQSVSQKGTGDQSNTNTNSNVSGASQLAAALAMRRSRILLCGFPLSEQIRDSNRGMTALRDRDLVIVLTIMRSGSSFFGQLLEKSSDVLYFYEPLKGLAYQAASQKFTLIDEQKLQLELLQSISTCNFNTKVAQQLLQDISLSRHSSRVISHTFVSPPLCPRDCGQALRCPVLQSHTVHQVCMSKKATVIKTIRIKDIRLLKQLADQRVSRQSSTSDTGKPARLTIAHLVRDPRAVVFSRLRIGGLLQRDYKATHGHTPTSGNKTILIDSEAKNICTEMWSNLQYAAMQPDWLRGHYHIFRFEDIALAVESGVVKLYDHFGLQMDRSVNDWIEQNTKVNMGTTRLNPYATTRNSQFVVNAWRTLLNTKEGQAWIKVIESRCHRVMNFLGYKFVNEEFSVPDEAAQHAPDIFMSTYTRE